MFLNFWPWFRFFSLLVYFIISQLRLLPNLLDWTTVEWNVGLNCSAGLIGPCFNFLDDRYPFFSIPGFLLPIYHLNFWRSSLTASRHFLRGLPPRLFPPSPLNNFFLIHLLSIILSTCSNHSIRNHLTLFENYRT